MCRAVDLPNRYRSAALLPKVLMRPKNGAAATAPEAAPEAVTSNRYLFAIRRDN